MYSKAGDIKNNMAAYHCFTYVGRGVNPEVVPSIASVFHKIRQDFWRPSAMFRVRCCAEQTSSAPSWIWREKCLL